MPGTSCFEPELKARFPRDRVNWTGAITMTLACHRGYDFPLNTPTGNTFTCFPDGSPWQPDYIPDCNPKQVPGYLDHISAVLLTPELCSTFEQLSIVQNMVSFASGKTMRPIRACESYRHKGITCNVEEAKTSCQMTEAKKTPAAPLRISQPHFAMKVAIAYVHNVPWNAYQLISNAIAQAIVEDLQWNAAQDNVLTQIIARCDTNSVGVLQQGLSVVCRGCSLGHFLDREAKMCIPCHPGYYGDTPFQTSCKLCPALIGITEHPLWDTVTKEVPYRTHTIASCPEVVKDEEGILQIRLAKNSLQEESLLQHTAHKDGACCHLSCHWTHVMCILALFFGLLNY